MQIDLAGRVALVTGASAGIGAATVRSLAAAGARVAFCARSKGGVDDLARELTGRGTDVRGYVADMAVAEEISAFLDHVDADLGAVEILVNNVGSSPSRNFLYMSDDDWTSLFELNLMSAVRCSRRLLPAMRAAGWGRIVMVSTAAAKYPSAPLIDYAASKAAMIATGKALSMRYGADNVLVNSVLPGLIDTPMWERTADEVGQATGRSPDEVIGAMARSVPLGRYGTAHEVANLIVFLCSEAASYISGAAIPVDGGQGTAVL